MESIWTAIAVFLGIYTFAIISPGPNFILVTNTALFRSRREGLLTSVGVATGSGVFAFAGLVGLLPLLLSLPYSTVIVRFAGGGCLIWFGVEIMRSCRKKSMLSGEGRSGRRALTRRPYLLGLLTNLTNAKAWAFYLSLFALLMTPAFPVWGKVVLNITMFLISLCWYSAVAYLISHRTFQPAVLKAKPVIQIVQGLLLIVAGAGMVLDIV